VVWTAHVAEFSDLSAAERAECMDWWPRWSACCATGCARQDQPGRLGNMVAHLHWHVIARWRWDSHFPGSVWAAVQRPRDPAREAEVQAQLRHGPRDRRGTGCADVNTTQLHVHQRRF
jgi:diadenosine tetraphosphate (Ap4A) HIT family hydrolase